MGSLDRLAAHVKGVSYGGRRTADSACAGPWSAGPHLPFAEGSSPPARKAREEKNDDVNGIRGPRKQGTT
ncbi:hypothetical protein QFZ49_006614 [Streptomyces turgidiscabies]|uniref:Uncharacterized protein n=1 Tax=Streptomyces turgidiscabies TaxID=85558 RepID=A0ABU0RXC6_9ACTN|nr:hypothetical protein [Streptomyces turgidiscabies]